MALRADRSSESCKQPSAGTEVYNRSTPLCGPGEQFKLGTI